MKKIHLKFLLATVILLNSTKSFSQSFEDDKNYVSVGYGGVTFIGTFAKVFEEESGYEFSGLGPIYLKYERALSDKIGFGATLAYAGYKFNWTDTYDDYNTSTGNYETKTYNYQQKFSTYSILARLNIHFGDGDKFDPYWGVGLGYRAGNWSYSDNDPDSDSDIEVKTVFPFGFESTLGARYYFTDNIGAYAEVGLAKSVFQAGLNFKL